MFIGSGIILGLMGIVCVFFGGIAVGAYGSGITERSTAMIFLIPGIILLIISAQCFYYARSV